MQHNTTQQKINIHCYILDFNGRCMLVTCLGQATLLQWIFLTKRLITDHATKRFCYIIFSIEITYEEKKIVIARLDDIKVGVLLADNQNSVVVLSSNTKSSCLKNELNSIATRDSPIKTL